MKSYFLFLLEDKRKTVASILGGNPNCFLFPIEKGKEEKTRVVRGTNGKKREGTEAEENSATSGEDQIAQAQLCFILLRLWPARELGGETQFG